MPPPPLPALLGTSMLLIRAAAPGMKALAAALPTMAPNLPSFPLEDGDDFLTVVSSVFSVATGALSAGVDALETADEGDEGAEDDEDEDEVDVVDALSLDFLAGL